MDFVIMQAALCVSKLTRPICRPWGFTPSAKIACSNPRKCDAVYLENNNVAQQKSKHINFNI